MKALNTKAIILNRTNYGEADRILTALTPNEGKLRLMAKGVRKVKSKLAGGIELFSVSEISFIRGRSELNTLTSARLITHYSHIAQDLNRVKLGYEFLRIVNRVTEDYPEDDYFKLLSGAFKYLDSSELDLSLIRLWFGAQLLKLNGYTPNLNHSVQGSSLQADDNFSFNLDTMCFQTDTRGKFSANHVKVLRLLFSDQDIDSFNQITDLQDYLDGAGDILKLVLWQQLPQVMSTDWIKE